MTVQLKVRRQPGDAFLARDRPDLHHAVVVPGLVVAAELDLEAVEAVPADPVAQQHGITVVRLLSVEVRRIDRVEPADEVPDGKFFRSLLHEEVHRILPAEGRVALEKVGEVTREEFGSVSLVDRSFVEAAVGIVHGDVEERETDEGGEVGQVGLGAAVRIEGFLQRVEAVLDEVVPEFHRVARGAPGWEVAGDREGEVLQGGEAFLVGDRRRPHPRDRKGCFAPAIRRLAVHPLDHDPHPRAGDRVKHLGPELQGNPHRDGEEIERGFLDTGGFGMIGHGGRGWRGSSGKFGQIRRWIKARRREVIAGSPNRLPALTPSRSAFVRVAPRGIR